MSLPTIRDRRSLVQEFIRRMLAYTDEVSWFGPSSVIRAFAEAVAGLVEGAYLLWVALVKRYTLMASSGDALTQTAAERGANRLPAQAAKVLVIFQPETANVSAITSGGTDLIEVDDSTPFQAGDEIRVRNGDGTVTELRTIIAITIGTGPGGGDEVEVATLTGPYSPGSDDVDVLFRALVPTGTEISTTVGVVFETLADVYTSDANPVLDGESTYVGLADKTWCECQTKGAAGNIEPLTVTELVATIRGVKAVSNPEPGTGGADEEADFDLKYRAIHAATIANQETEIWLETLARAGNGDVLRAFRTTSTTVGTMAALVLHRNGGPFTTAALAEMESYIEDRVRSYMAVSLGNVTLTSVEVEAVITLNADATLESIGKAASSSLAAFLDYRKWKRGTAVDEADLLTIVNTTPGVATLESASFLPASDVAVGAESFPVLVRLSLEDATSGLTWNADLAVSF